MNAAQFQVIPVLDIRTRQAVRAVAGNRAAYAPLATPLAPGTADPVAIAAGYRRLFPFPTLYVADLDGIEGRGAARDLHQRIAVEWGGSEIWVDDGTAGSDRAGLTPGSVCETTRQSLRRTIDVSGEHGAKPVGSGPATGSAKLIFVMGSESVPVIQAPGPPSSRRRPGSSQREGETLADLGPGLRRGDAGSGNTGSEAAILSLDFRGDAFIGDPRWLDAAELWPRRVIVMTLARVGTGGGPDLTRLEEIIGRAGSQRQVYAAGGVRSPDDLRRLSDLGVAGALVATALHTGQIKTGDLEEIAGSSSQSTSAEWLP